MKKIKMDIVDQNQQEELDRLHRQARRKRTEDLWQWLVMLALGLGGLIYLNVVFTSIIREQAKAIQKLSEKVRK